MTIGDVMEASGLPRSLPAVNAPQRTYKDVVRHELDYVTEGLHKSVHEAHRAVQWLLNDVLHRQHALKRWVFLGGKSGCGKTHLGKKAVEVLLQHGYHKERVQFWTWRGAMREILNDGGAMRWLAGLHVLVLDDIGTGYTESDRAAALNASLLYELLEARLGKWTIITSNLAPADIGERLDVRITSRLYRGLNEVVNMSEARDYCLLRRQVERLTREGGSNV